MVNIDLVLQASMIQSWKWTLPTNSVGSPCFSPNPYICSLDKFLENIHPDDIERVRQELYDALSTSYCYVDNFRIRQIDGRVEWFIGRGTVYFDELTQEKIVIGFWINVKEPDSYAQLSRHSVNLALNSELYAMHEMAVMTLHELSQPLTVINTYLSGCLRRIQDANLKIDGMVEVMEKIKSQGMLAANLLRKMNDYITKPDLRYETINLHHLIKLIATTLSSDINFPIKIQYIFDQTIPLIGVDVIKMQIAILNLMNNRFKYIRERNEKPNLSLVIETMWENKNFIALIFWVRSDTPPNSYTKETPSSSSKLTIADIDLAICKSVVEEHKGNISFQSSLMGDSCFKITLPIFPLYSAE